MTAHTRKLIGAMAILLWLPVYGLIAMLVGLAVLPRAGSFAAFLYYGIAGTLWIVPIGLMLPWMQREG